MGVDRELAEVLAATLSGQDLLPFMQMLHPTNSMAFRPLPAEMLAILKGSQDYAPVPPGAAPVHMLVESEAGHAVLILYRSRYSGVLYVLAPAAS